MGKKLTRFSELSREMKAVEKSFEAVIPKDALIVVRLDGRAFTTLTRKTLGFTEPFDERFHKWMIETADALLGCGIPIPFVYTQSDEISLVVSDNGVPFGRRECKLLTILSGVASSAFSLASGVPAAFDARLIGLRSDKAVGRYFTWRLVDSERNCLNGYAYWTMRNSGLGGAEIAERLKGMPSREKYALLDGAGIDLRTAPLWQKRGSAGFFVERMAEGVDGLTGEPTRTLRRSRVFDEELPAVAEFGDYVIGKVFGTNGSEEKA
ncbi:MAG: hypothetical protein MR009_02320 [Sutterellaceae bacterium]|nr:hypothetical protein [Sutterellaceae bacterium]MDD7441152.1 tRNA(His) guanylyltransferase Thg1 family protein [Sutterellaceae bacterium]MDY2868482.1 tRNA(His) guanylyltransferase Thg1 family protein [Mesosutterella sp.]